jgi:hypothetical protein
MLPWGIERATQAEAKAVQAEAKADEAVAKAQAAEVLAEQERRRAEKLAELLRAQGIDPDNVD